MWSEKAGCTTVVKWLFNHLNILGNALTYSNWVHDYENSVFKKADSYFESLQKAITDDVPIIKFVRDPYARAFSGYLELCKLANFNKKGHWANEVRKSVLNEMLGFQTNLEYGFSFSQYLKWLSNRDHSSLNSHIRMQYMEYESKLNIGYFKIEDFNNRINQLEEEYGLPSTPKWMLEKFAGSGHHFIKSDDISKEQVLKLAHLAIPVRKLASFSLYNVNKELVEGTEIGDLIKGVFEKDIETYGY